MNTLNKNSQSNPRIKSSAIGRFSSFFVKRYRITLLLFITIMAFGFFSYTGLLKIEGFPAVEVPVVFVQANYFVNDAAQINREVTTPIEEAAGELSEVKKVSSTTTPVGAMIVAEFDENISSIEGQELLHKQLDKKVSLPAEASLEYRVINAGSVDGEHDLIFDVSANDASLVDLQNKASE